MSETRMEKPGFAQNLKKGFASPGAKVISAVVVLCIVGFGLLAWKKFNAVSGPPSGSADVGGFDVRGGRPRGATDPETANAVGAAADQTAAAAAAGGRSYAGPFVFEASSEGAAATGAQGGNASSSLSNSANVKQATSDTLMALRKRVAEYDASEDAATARDGGAGQGGSRSAQSDGSGNAAGAAARTNQAGPNGDYGMGQDGFKQITGQLDRIGKSAWSYASLTNGVLTRPEAVQTAATSRTSATPAAATPTSGTSATKTNGEYTAARAGATCAAMPDSGYDTDISLPVFATLKNCGDLTEARVKGTILKSVDNFTVRFNALFPDPAKRLKVVGTFDASAVSIEKDGDPRIADNVDNHWFTRLGSSALLSLAKTEQSFIAARGTTQTNTGLSSSTTVDGLTDDQKRDARVAGVMQGTFDVVTRDVATGVNRPATMTTNKTTLIGVQFLDDVKVVRID